MFNLKIFLLALVALSTVQSNTIKRSKRQYGQYSQVAPAPAPLPVAPPVPAPVPVPAPLPVPPVPVVPPVPFVGGFGNPLVSLLLLGSLFGGNGGHRYGRRHYKREALENPEAEMILSSEDDVKQLFKRQLPLGAGLPVPGVLPGIAPVPGMPVPMPVPMGLGLTGSPILDIVLLGSLLGNGRHGRRYDRDVTNIPMNIESDALVNSPNHELETKTMELNSEPEALTNEPESEPLEEENNSHRVKRQILGSGRGGNQLLTLLLLSGLGGIGGIVGK